MMKTGALILSGGRSRRMGKDKTIVEFEGEPLLLRAVRFWKAVPDISKIYLSIGSEEHLEKLKKDGRLHPLFSDGSVVFVKDQYENGGPMAGLHAAFRAGEEDWLYVCAVDMLNMKADALPVPGNAEAYVYAEGELVEPLFALYSRKVLGPAEQLLNSGRGKMQDLLELVQTEFLPIQEEQREIFFNCNTPEDLKRFQGEKKE